MQFSREDLRRFWPQGDPAWVDAFYRLHEEFGERYGVTTPRRWRHFLAQVSAETDGLQTSGKAGRPLPGMVENHKYTAAGALRVFKYRIGLEQRRRYRGRSLAEVAHILTRDPEMLFNAVYGDRPELGNTQPGDGWRFRGRGPIQLTGRHWYELFARETGIRTDADPDLLSKPDVGWQATFFEWAHAKCGQLADKGEADAVTAVSRRINGGANGLAARRHWFAKAAAMFGDGYEGEPAEARQEATSADLARVSTREGLTATAEAGAKIIGGASAVAVVAKEGGSALSGLADQAGELTGYLTTLQTLGRALNDFGTFASEHALVLLFLGALGMALALGRIRRRALVEYREGRYEPSGGSARPAR